MHGKILWGSVISVSWYNERNNKRVDSPLDSKSSQGDTSLFFGDPNQIPALYVEAIPFSVTLEELEDLFCPFGKLVPKGTHFGWKNGVRQGYAFVKYLHKEDGDE